MIYIEEQMKLHPSMSAQDIVKMCYQAAFGAEHLICDKDSVCKYFDEEFRSISPTDEPLYELISDKVCRINMGAWKKRDLPPCWLFEMFAMSAKIDKDVDKAFAEHLSKAKALFPDFEGYFNEYSNGGIRPVHHSDCYRQAEQPHYRVVSNRFIRLLPILEKINSANAKVVVIDGRAASGKTTAADELNRITGAPIVHMDDFFLPPSLRTEARLSEAGGNIHYERFIEEVLPNLRSGKEFSYTVFDCSTMSFGGKRAIKASPFIIIEGAYSCHPLFGDYADIKVFSDISPDEQIKRIISRNGEKMAETFASRWIPMEEKYYKEFRIKENADLVLD